MYSIDKYCFKEFKIVPGHRANYAILCKPEYKENQWGMKYSPANNYQREYKILPLFSHPQISARYAEGNAMMHKDGKSVIIQNYLIISHFEGEDVVEYYKKKGLPNQDEMENVIRYFTNATLPLHHMHSKGYIHCDIKPGHLILNPATGTMEMIHLLRSMSDREDEKSVLKKVRLNTASDIYSVGLIFYQVLTGKLWQETPV